MMKTLMTLAMVALMASVSFAQEKESNSTDQVVAAVQKICPVSGKELGDNPIKSEIDGQAVMLCCEGCKGKPADEKHMKTIMARMAKAQGNCPIMKQKKVTADSKKTMVNGHPVFACCNKCVSKIEGEGEAILKTVVANYKEFVGDEMVKAAQKICPVSGQELGEDALKMTREDGEVVFLCCEGCKGKDFNEEHWKTIQANQAKAQGNCPVMGKPVTADKESTVVNGRRVFVCCEPCIEKIKADPEKFVGKLNSQIAESMKAK